MLSCRIDSPEFQPLLKIMLDDRHTLQIIMCHDTKAFKKENNCISHNSVTKEPRDEFQQPAKSAKSTITPWQEFSTRSMVRAWDTPQGAGIWLNNFNNVIQFHSLLVFEHITTTKNSAFPYSGFIVRGYYTVDPAYASWILLCGTCSHSFCMAGFLWSPSGYTLSGLSQTSSFLIMSS